MRDDYILLVEDNPDDIALTRRALLKNKIANDLAVAHDGAEAIDNLSTAADAGRLPALVLLDLNLPKLNGFEVLDHIRSDPRTELLPVVVLTSSKQDDDIITSYRNGANAYVRKPVDFAEFTKAVAMVGVFWLLLNEVPTTSSALAPRP